MTLKLENVNKTVNGACHLAEIDLVLHPGTPHVLFGRTLAGKTSLLRLMAGLDRPSSGRILFHDRDVTHAGVRERSVAMVYQQFINYPAFTVYDNIASPLRIKRLPRTEIDQKVKEAAALVRIDHLMDRLPAELSGGQQQRVAIARALAKEADLLLLDEPLVNLDYKLREELRAELKSIFRRREAIVVYATTEPLEAMLLGGQTVVLDEGRVLQAGPTLKVFHHPASVQVTQVFSEPPMNLTNGVIDSTSFCLNGAIKGPCSHHLQRVAPDTYRFGVRANHLSLVRRGGGDIEIKAAVELAEVSGSETFVHVAIDCGWVVQGPGVHGFHIGEVISVYLNPRHLFVFGKDGSLVASPAIEAALAAAE